jgi:acetyl-CoA decarbonylase/synthase complex subunit gamma
MALTGLQIQKLLPKTNCKECGSNTCLAFAMKLAAKKAELKECPYASDEAKAVLGAAAEPPVRTITLGAEQASFRAGGETVLYRHEKTFVNQTGLGLALPDTLELDAFKEEVRKFAAYTLERVGEKLQPNLISIECRSGSAKTFRAALAVAAELWDRALAARSEDPSLLQEAAQALPGRRLLLASATPQTVNTLAGIAAESKSALALAADNFDALTGMIQILQEKNFREIFIELRANSLGEHFQNNTLARRVALKSGIKTLGYPVLKYINTGNPLDDAVEAGLEIAKYGSLAVLPAFDPAIFMPLLTLRQNIYTDPQKPIQVEPKIYAIGEPGETSPVFVTTNFSLTYFIVSGEIENAGLSAWLAVPECEGMSVLTSWAAGKFGGAKIGAFIKESGLENRLKTRKIVIPGYVAQISGELEEALPGWQVLVGPQEASDIESFAKNVLAKK